MGRERKPVKKLTVSSFVGLGPYSSVTPRGVPSSVINHRHRRYRRRCRKPVKSVHLKHVTKVHPEKKLVDLFCCSGGFSIGAHLAGYKPVLGIDMNPKYLEMAARINPNCEYKQIKLGSEGSMKATKEAICAKVAPGENFHLHFSTSCNQFTTMKNFHKKSPEDIEKMKAARKEALYLVRFVLRLVLIKLPNEGRTPTITFENHHDDELVALLNEWAAKFPTRLAILPKVQFADAGLPQKRERLLAGSPEILEPFIKKLREHPVHTTIDSLFKKRDWQLQSNYVRTMNGGLSRAKPVDGLCTSITSRGCDWVDSDGKKVANMTIEQIAAIQGFPSGIDWPKKEEKKRTVCKEAIGHAVPPLLAFKLMGGSKTQCLEEWL